MSEILTTKEELLNKLRAYADTPDDDNIRYKEKIHDALLNNAELLYALNNEELESELFDGNELNIDEETGELLGEVSYGMCCSPKELGLNIDYPAHHLLEIEEDIEVGHDFFSLQAK